MRAAVPDAGGAGQPAAGVAGESGAPTKKKPARGILAKKAEAEAKARADYFTPGNIVKSYSGHDRVIAYSPPDADGAWSVKVRAVQKQGDAWVDTQERERQHATQPDARELKAGPVARSGGRMFARSWASSGDIFGWARAVAGERLNITSAPPSTLSEASEFATDFVASCALPSSAAA